MSRRRRIIVLFFSFLAVLVVGSYIVLVYTGASRSIVESVMSRFIRSRFELQDAEFDPTTGTVSIEGVQIGHPTLGETDVLVADRVVLDVNTNPLGSEELGRVRGVRIEKLHLHLSFTDVEKWDLMEVLEFSELDEGSSDYPAVTITDSVVTVRLTDDRPAVDFTAVHLELRPDAEDDQRMVLTGSMRTPEGFEVRISGAGDLGKNQFQALFETEDLPLRPRIARPYSTSAQRYLADAKLTGSAKKASLWVRYPAQPGDVGDVSGQLTVDVERAGWNLQDFPYPIADASGKVTVSTRDGGRVHFDLLSEGAGRTIRMKGDLTQCLSGAPLVDFLVKSAGVPVDDVLRNAVDKIPTARMVWRAFEPSSGHVDADLYFHNDEPGGAGIMSMDLRLRDVDGRFMGFQDAIEPGVSFPYRIDDVSGLIQLRNDKVQFKDITGQRSDGGRARVHGSLTQDENGDTIEIMLDIEAEDVAFSDELRTAVEALQPGGGAIYSSYSPAGKGDVDIKVRQQPGEASPQFTVVMTPRGASASYDFFPYRLEDLRGKIELTSSGVVFDLTGHNGAVTVDLGGRFLFEVPEDGLAFELWLHGKNLPLDRRLRNGLLASSPELDQYWQQFEPEGTVDCQLTLWQGSHEEDLQHDVRLDFHEGSVVIRQFETTLENLQGSVFVHGSGLNNHMDVSTLRGQVDNGAGTLPAEVVLEGTLRVEEERSKLDITTIVRGLQLNDDLATKLDNADIVSRPTWRVLKPAGAVDLSSHREKRFDDPEVKHRVRVQLHDVSSSAAVLPSPLTGLQGELKLANERGDFDEIRGQLGNATVSAEGFFEHETDRTVIGITLSADELAVDSSFAKLMTGPLQKVFRDRNIRGTLGISGFSMRYTFPDEGDDFELRFGGTLIATNLTLSLLAQIDGINGTLDFDESTVTPDGGKVTCHSRNASFRVLGHQATDFSAIWTTDPESIAVRDLEMKMHGGRLVSDGKNGQALAYDLAKDVLSAQLRWDEMSLTQFMRAIGETSPISRGTVSGMLDITLPGSEMGEVRAKAELQVRDGRLGEVPIFKAIYAFLSPSNRPQFERLLVKLEVDGDGVRIDELELTSPLFEVKGDGTIDLDGYVDIVLEFPDFFASSGKWFILPQILRALTSQVVRFHVFGYLRSPRARPRWLFQDDPSRLRIGPIPARLRLPQKKPF